MTSELTSLPPSLNAALCPPSQVKLSRTWTISFDKQMIDFEIDKLVLPKINSHHLVALDKIQLPTHNKDLYVGWNATKIIKLPTTQLIYSTEFSVCIAVLVRGFKPSDISCPSHLGFAHVMGSPEIIEPMISEIERETDKGPIEIFICGGYGSDINSAANYQKLLQLIQKLSQNKSHIRILDDHFSIMDIPGFYLITNNDIAHQGSPGLSFAGFDANYNPYVVLGAEFKTFKGSREDIVKFWREENSELVECLHLSNKKNSPIRLISRFSSLAALGMGLLLSGIAIYVLVYRRYFFNSWAMSKP